MIVLGTYNKKVWVAVPVARPTRLGVSHSPSLKVEQRRSPHENMYLHPRMNLIYNIGTIRAVIITYPLDIHRCFVSERLLICLRDNLASQRTKRHSRHLFNICIPTHPLLLFACFRCEDGAKIQKKIETTKYFCKKVFSRKIFARFLKNHYYALFTKISTFADIYHPVRKQFYSMIDEGIGHLLKRQRPSQR